MGTEFAQEAEWAEERSLDWWLLDQPVHAAVQRMVTDLNALYRKTPAMWENDHDPAGFAWIDANDTPHNVFSFTRFDAAGNPLVCLVNFAGTPHEGYRVGLPRGGKWTEVLNTDAAEYGGSGVGNLGTVTADATGWHGLPSSVVLRVPPLAALYLQPADPEPADPAPAADR
jgi:1,4-alpha-glucan branching enzyme